MSSLGYGESSMRAMGPNDRLRQALEAAGYSVERLAEAVGYHPKQVGRWVSQGMVPRRSGAKADVARVLDVHENDIWPTVGYAPTGPAGAVNEIAGMWAHRADVPASLWWDLIVSAERRIDLLGCAMLFLPEQHPHLHREVAARCEAGLQVRIMLLDPDGEETRRRDALEELGGVLPARIRTTLHHFAPVLACPGVELRLVDVPLYNAMYRFDDHLLVTPYLVGKHGYQHPVLHLRRRGDSGVFAGFADQYDTLWAGPHRQVLEEAS